MKKFLLSAVVIASGLAATAQSPTVVTTVTNCSVFRNFNLSDEGFSSPSIYSDGNDVSFSWNAGAGAEIESSGLVGRSGSLISPVYVQSEPGHVTLGFKYTVPVNTQYRVRVISAVSTSPLEILATTANGPVYTSLAGTSGNVCIALADADLEVGHLIRFEFTFRAITPGNITFDDLALSVAGGPLPVTFEGFVARKNTDESIKLLWNVGEEVNVKGYYVESSTDGINFTNATYVTATGKSIYSFDYPGKTVQTLFFRVKNVDFDGRSKYSATIKVYSKTQATAQIQIYPMPAREQVTIQHNKATENTVITILSPEGKILQRKAVVASTLQTQLNISGLAAGIYFVKYDDGTGNTQSVKLIKN
ncbi:T9SS type A sorting domain-containing protein [Ferruginibacter sp. SUN106]|uniref:T9SS type A sorting domain-containing protein n=1 Tax=Ferruginibacter sp. SUN106 TaxID=2978348 RepID=UPI003D35BEE5